MKSFRLLLALGICTVALAACSSDEGADAPASSSSRAVYKDGQKATVTSVESGNTVKVDIEGSSREVRLTNVVAPSENNNVPSGSCLMQESLDFLAQKLPEGKEVTLNFDDRQLGTSGFLEAAVMVGDEMINESVVAEGLAATTYVTGEDEFYLKISAAQQKAAEQKKGLYSPDVECSVPHGIAEQMKKLKSAGDLNEEKRESMYRETSEYYNVIVKSQESPSSYLGSITTLEAIKPQVSDLRLALGDNYYDQDGMSVSEKASASASATARPGS